MAKPERCDNCGENPPTHALSDLSDGETGYMCVPCLLNVAMALGDAWVSMMGLPGSVDEAPGGPIESPGGDFEYPHRDGPTGADTDDDGPEPGVTEETAEAAPPARKRG